MTGTFTLADFRLEHDVTIPSCSTDRVHTCAGEASPNHSHPGDASAEPRTQCQVCSFCLQGGYLWEGTPPGK